MNDAMAVAEEATKVVEETGSSKEGLIALGIGALLLVGSFGAGYALGRFKKKDNPKKKNDDDFDDFDDDEDADFDEQVRKVHEEDNK